MIDRLVVRNFLSIRELDIRLNKVNVFVGPNASGKSNIVRALHLIQSLSYGAPHLPGYTYESLHFAYNVYEPIVVSVWSDNVGVSLSIGGGKYVEEVLRGGDVLLKHDGESPSAGYRDRTGVFKTVYLYAGIAVKFMGTGSNVYPSVFSLPTPPLDLDPELDNVFKLVKSIGVFSFVPQSIRAYSSVTDKPIMGYNGDGLARFLLELYLKRRKSFSMIEDVLRSLVPEVEELVPSVEGMSVVIRIRVRGMEEPLPPQNISDGTLRLLAIATVLNAGYSVVAIEEPENCIHPYLLEALVDMVRRSPSQVIITTHSPHLLDYFRPEEVYLVSKRDLESVVTRLSDSKEVEAVKKFLEEGGTLGEAWYSRIFG